MKWHQDLGRRLGKYSRRSLNWNKWKRESRQGQGLEGRMRRGSTKWPQNANAQGGMRKQRKQTFRGGEDAEK